MPSFTLLFLAGIMTCQFFTHLPSLLWSWGIFIGCGIVIYFTRQQSWRWLRLPCAYALGFAWVLAYVTWQMSFSLPYQWESKPLVITGEIASIPHVKHEQSSFLFSIDTIQYQQQRLPVHGLVLLHYHQKDKKLFAGDRWQWVVRLKRIHGLMNPGGIDYQALALQKGIRANGTVIENLQNHCVKSQWYRYPITRARQWLQQKIEKNQLASETSQWIIALTVGERSGIEAKKWEILRNTGTNHLMAIAGLHIGCLVGIVFFLTERVWRFFPRACLCKPAREVAAIVSLVAAVIYSAMAGFAIPTQRAMLMLAVFLGAVLLRRKLPAWHAWSLALFLVLLINPLDVLNPSFWLSFGTVALIIYGVSARTGPHSMWWKFGRMQWVISLGLIPFSILFFQECSWVSLIANVLTIPCVGFVIVPLSLIGCVLLLFSDSLGGYILWIADQLLGWVWKLLAWLSGLSAAVWHQSIPSFTVLLISLIGVLFLLLPRYFPGRYLGFFWLLPLILFRPLKPALGEVQLTLLDVGQGLSAVIQTKNHALVFDAGPRFGDNYDVGESVVTPFLYHIGLRVLDVLVISHADNDHIGGSSALLKRFPVNVILTSALENFPSKNSEYCLPGTQWTWDQVHFEFLYPPQEYLFLKNNSSCVLRVSIGTHSILLTGDIEKAAEKFLLAQPQKLSADILIAPHHGSRTSSTSAFTAAVQPKYVLFATGYRNRYPFPNQVVVARYQALGAQQFATDKTGAIHFQVNAAGVSQPHLYRQEHGRYWND